MARSGPGPQTGWSSQTIRPDVGSNRPAIRFSSVLLPQPEWPIRQTNSFMLTSIEIESIARNRPLPLMGKSMETRSTLRNAMRLLAEAQLAADPGKAGVEREPDQPDQQDRDDHAGELQVVPFVPDEIADPALRADHLGGDDHEPGDPDRDAHAGHDHRYARRKHDP